MYEAIMVVALAVPFVFAYLARFAFSEALQFVFRFVALFSVTIPIGLAILYAQQVSLNLPVLGYLEGAVIFTIIAELFLLLLYVFTDVFGRSNIRGGRRVGFR